MGAIYLARFCGVAGFEKRCVIKKILPEYAQVPAFVNKFLDEGRVLVELTHSNIVQIFDMGCENGEYYLAMEHIEGADLRFLLKQMALHSRRVDLGVACHIIMEVLKGLSYAHRATNSSGVPMQLIHRDISPSNLLISNEGEIKIIDFGIAKWEASQRESTASMVQGKFAYMSPEQARGEVLDARTDIFSLGIVFYEMLTGIRPFEGASDLQSLERIKTLETPSIHGYRDDIPQALADIIHKSLEKNRENRFESADAFYDALEQFLLDESLKPRQKDVVAEFSSIMKGDEALVVHSSEDFFDEAFQALLDAQSQNDRSSRTRSMCLTQSFSKELPKAEAEDFVQEKREHLSVVSLTPSNPWVTPAQVSRRRRIKSILVRMRYGLVGALIATLLIVIAVGNGLINLKKDGSPTEAALEPNTASGLTDEPVAEVTSENGEVKKSVRALNQRAIDLDIRTIPENAQFYIREGAYRKQDKNHVLVIPDRDIRFDISADGYETCQYTIVFSESMPRINSSHCAGVSTQYGKDMSSAIINIELMHSMADVRQPLPEVSPIKQVVNTQNNNNNDSSRKQVRLRLRSDSQETSTEKNEYSVSVRSNVPAVVKLNQMEYALPTEIKAAEGTVAMLVPIHSGRDISVSQKITIKSDQYIEASFCRAIVHINEFYLPGDPMPYQIADFLIDDVLYASDRDVATFVLPCGKHTISARYNRDGVNLKASQIVTLSADNVYKTALTLK